MANKKLISAEVVERTLSALLPEIVNFLRCDRCFLYVRNPETRWGKVAFCYCRDRDLPDITDRTWQLESSAIERQDPMFAAALNCKPSIFVEDVETANFQVVNREFERKHFGHKALIHAHLCCEDRLWGVLQPEVFYQPRIWSQIDRLFIEEIAHLTTPLVIEYVQRHTNSIAKDIKK
ncbi:MAG: GAF domain-containing protein [Cyanosarcina radialis HA8281-LM2]|jgi:GAF domain-containing protein|nr:GAF domain-containing protein [Cyanosarcina radialis HA8281-LM2]